jgi:hypothetical protein
VLWALSYFLELWFSGRNRFRREFFGYWSLLRKLLPQLVGLALRNVFPASVDLRFPQFSGNLGLRGGDWSQSCGRGQDVKLISLDRRIKCCVGLGLGGVVNSIIRNLLAHALLDQLRNSLKLRTVIYDDVICVGNIGNVRRPIDDRQVLLWRKAKFAVRGTAKIADPDEGIGGRADSIITVGPRVNSHVNTESGFGRKGGPTHVVVVIGVAPRDPSRGPSLTWHPDPAHAIHLIPTSVVIGSPTKIFVGIPKPPAICPNPVTVRIGSPRGCRDGHVWLPDVAIVIGVKPVSILRQPIIENIIIPVRIRIRVAL